MSEQRAELQGKRGSGPHGLVIRTLPCCCTSDRFLQSRGHIITFTHFCPVSRSTKASQCWVEQWKKCREVSSVSGLQLTSEENTSITSISKGPQETGFPFYSHYEYYGLSSRRDITKFTIFNNLCTILLK